MAIKKIVLAGGTGFVGSYLTGQFTNLGYEVMIISRGKGNVQWQDTTAVMEAIDGSGMIINLAGKSINCRHTEKNKAAILESRIDTTKAIGTAILQCANPPELWINASGANIYSDTENRPMTESTGEIGTGFMVDVAKSWEQAFLGFNLPHTRQVALRMAVVLGKDGGLVKPYINLVRFGLGGKQGDGKQMLSWIHLADLFGIITYLQKHTELWGIFNCSSPNAIDNKTLMKTFRQIMNVKIGLPSPKLILEIGAIIIGTEAELTLKSCWVVPERLLEAGYVFKYPTIDKALKNILDKE